MAHEDSSVSSLNTKSFYRGLTNHSSDFFFSLLIKWLSFMRHFDKYFHNAGDQLRAKNQILLD